MKKIVSKNVTTWTKSYQNIIIDVVFNRKWNTQYQVKITFIDKVFWNVYVSDLERANQEIQRVLESLQSSSNAFINNHEDFKI